MVMQWKYMFLVTLTIKRGETKIWKYREDVGFQIENLKCMNCKEVTPNVGDVVVGQIDLC